ncbi:hypothetical protein HYALB_00010760 [Hymenoscyphus albidus]|uniref:Uncharacterized protein n=1 Tax=Hymenoscyphus albidus TaxID=595503 RepID=A0A9N9LLS2_9HELO|nr:hypothetical protein HYALB_00010760 [Hymenoscyphus albidus]
MLPAQFLRKTRRRRNKARYRARKADLGRLARQRLAQQDFEEQDYEMPKDEEHDKQPEEPEDSEESEEDEEEDKQEELQEDEQGEQVDEPEEQEDYPKGDDQEDWVETEDTVNFVKFEVDDPEAPKIGQQWPNMKAARADMYLWIYKQHESWEFDKSWKIAKSDRFDFILKCSIDADCEFLLKIGGPSDDKEKRTLHTYIPHSCALNTYVTCRGEFGTKYPLHIYGEGTSPDADVEAAINEPETKFDTSLSFQRNFPVSNKKKAPPKREITYYFPDGHRWQFEVEDESKYDNTEDFLKLGALEPIDQSEECLFINRLPLDVRNRIYRKLLRRPVGIIPCSGCNVRDTPGTQLGRGVKAYDWGYVWKESHAIYGDEDWIRYRRRRAQRKYNIKYNRRYVDHRDSVPPLDYERLPDPWDPYDEFDYERSDKDLRVQKFGKVRNLLVTCRQIYHEACEILYGENTFVFITCNYRIHDPKEVRKAQSRIPGYPDRYGRPPSIEKTVLDVYRIFGEEIYRQQFLYRDQMLRFFNRIGLVNTSRIKKVRLEGVLKPKRAFPVDEEDFYFVGATDGLDTFVPMAFSETLRILLVVLKIACPTLYRLDLMLTDGLWIKDDRPYSEDPNFSCEDEIDAMVEMVAKGLPSLNRLILSDWTDNQTHPLNWGKSRLWVKFVEEREAVPPDYSSLALMIKMSQIEAGLPPEGTKRKREQMTAG